MTNALLISAIGMSLVFIGLILLWGMMALLVRVTSLKSTSFSSTDAQKPIAPERDRHEEKNLAAAIAVATAMALQSKVFWQGQRRDDGRMTPWQVAHRSTSLSQKPSHTRRKD